MLGRTYFSTMVVVVCSWLAGVATAQDNAIAHAMVRDYLIQHGEPDNITVTDGISVTFDSHVNALRVGRLYSLVAKIKDSHQQVINTGEVILLALDSKQLVVPALQQWKGDHSLVFGSWHGHKVKFNNFFLTRELPLHSKLAVVVRSSTNNGKVFHVQTFQTSTLAGRYQLEMPIHHTLLESNPPLDLWMLSFNHLSFLLKGVQYYIKDESGSIISETHYSGINKGQHSKKELFIVNQQQTQDTGCFTLVVRMIEFLYAGRGETVSHFVAGNFGNCN